MQRLILAAVLAAAFSTTADAALYGFRPTHTNELMPGGIDHYLGAPAVLELTDAAVATGHFSWQGFSGPDGQPLGYSGDPGFVSFGCCGVGSFRLEPHLLIPANLILDLTFSPAGALIGGSIKLGPLLNGLPVGVPSGNFTIFADHYEATVFAEGGECTDAVKCGGVVLGGPAYVPEPMSAALLGVGLLGLAFSRRKAA